MQRQALLPARRALLAGLFLLLAGCGGLPETLADTPSDVTATAATERPAASRMLSGDYERAIQSDGRTRTYIVHLPPVYDSVTPLPLVVVLHGGGGNAAGTEKQTGMSAKADQAGFIAVYPNGTGPLDDRLLTWNTWNCCGYAEQRNVDDVAFIRALVAQLARDERIDPARIFATGLSNGGMMSYRLACEAADLFAAIAPVSGALNTDACAPAQPVSVIAFHGTADQNVPYNGGRGTKSFPGTRPNRDDQPVSYAIGFWTAFDQCDPTPQRTQTGSIARDDYTGASGTAVTLVTINGGGHAWPGGQRLAAFLDAPTQEISATDAIWDFFAQHPKS